MKLVLHGIFARDYGPSVEIEATSISDAIEGFSRQVGFYTDRVLADRPVVRVIGHHSVESFQECPEQIDLVPAMWGGGGNFGKILIGAALVAAVIFAPQLGIAGLMSTGIGAGVTVGAAVVSVGIGLALTGVMGIFVKAPSISKDGDPEASKYLGNSEMTTAIGTFIPYCLGRNKLGGHVLSLDVSSNSLTTGMFPAVP